MLKPLKKALALKLAARSLHRSRSYLGAYFRKMKAIHGYDKAITATAHKLARIIYHMLKTRRPYIDLGEEYFIEKNRKKQLNNLMKKATQLGFYLQPVANVS